MSIEFETITDPDVIGTAAVAMPRFGVRAGDLAASGIAKFPRFRAITGEGLINAAAIGMPRFRARAAEGDSGIAKMPRFDAYASGFIPPEINEAFVAFPRFNVSAVFHAGNSFSASVPMPRFRARAGLNNTGVAKMPHFRAYADDFGSSGAVFYAEQSTGYLSMLDPQDATHKFLFDFIEFHAETPGAQAVLALLDRIAFHDDMTQQLHLHTLIAVQMAFGDVIFGAPVGELADSVAFSDSSVSLAMYLATLLDSFSIAAELTKSAAIFAFLSDTVQFDDTLSVQQQILQALHDGIEFGITLFTGDDTYTAWVMTTETRAMRHYSNFAFNSYAHFGGKLIAAKDDGIYVLEGDTDAGQAINASVRTGLLDLGSRQLKRVTRAYMGYTAKGTLALRVTITSPQGKKIDYTYRMVKTAGAEAPRETRVIIGKGLQSVYWAFELDNSLDGEDFELHDVTVLPVILSRKVR